jgi:hypothetical protein
MILVTEKNLNKYAYPVFSAKGRKIVTPFVIADPTGKFVCQEGLMKPSNWTVMDILATYIYHRAYRNPGDPLDCNKKKYTAKDSEVYSTSRVGIHEDVLVALVRRSQEHRAGIIDDTELQEIMQDNYYCYFYRNVTPPPPRNIITLNLTDGELKKNFPFLKKYTSLDICRMFESTATCKVGMRYPVRFLDGKSTHNKEYNNYDYPCSFFTLTNVQCSKLSKNRHVLERCYTVQFDSYLGYFFIHNVISCYTDWLPENFYNLSDTAQLYYRRCILPFYNGVKSTLKLEEVQGRLQLITHDTHGLRRVIKRCMKELEVATYITDQKEEYLYGHYCYTAHRTPWKELKKD